MGLPSYYSDVSQLSMAVEYGSIACFRYLTIKRARHTQETLTAAITGGNQEIIQMCIEQGADVRSPGCLANAVKSDQHEIFTWLVDVYQVSVSTETLLGAFELRNWSFFASNYHMLSPILWFLLHEIDRRCRKTGLQKKPITSGIRDWEYRK